MASRPALGPRRELLLLMPVALLVLALLAVFTLFAYRNAIDLMLEQRELEAERLVRQVASELAAAPALDLEPWRRRLPRGSMLAIEDPSGRRSAVGDLSLLEESQLGGESTGRSETVQATARLEHRGISYTAQLDLPVPILRSRERGLEILVPVVVVVSGGITVLVLLFLRRFLAPLDRMVARARDAGQASGAQDEVDFLVDTFEKALEALASPPEVDELKAIEGTLVQSLKSGVLLCDAEGRVLSTNVLASRLLGLEESQIPTDAGEAGPAHGASAATSTPRLSAALASHPELLAAISGAIENGEAVERKEVTIHPADGERLLGLTVHPIRRDSGIRGFLAIFADLTVARARQEKERLVDSLAQLGELSAGVAHEMRNSLATLRGYLALIERRPEGLAVPAHLGEIRHESDHLQRVLEDFLTFARPGSVRPQETDVVALVRRAAIDPALEGASVEVEASGELRVLGDPQLLERAIRNLLHNAVEAHRSPGADPGEGEEPVWARVTSVGEGVEIRVEDRGPGLSDVARERLFDPFFSARPGGVGMGLALTRRIALLHAGTVALEPRSEGGTRAILWIPGVAPDGENDPPEPQD